MLKYINFDVKEDNSTIVGKHVLDQHWPLNSKSTVGAQLKFQRWANNSNSTVETLVLVQCWPNVSTPTVANNSNHYPTLAQRLLAIWAALLDLKQGDIITTFLL